MTPEQRVEIIEVIADCEAYDKAQRHRILMESMATIYWEVRNEVLKELGKAVAKAMESDEGITTRAGEKAGDH